MSYPYSSSSSSFRTLKGYPSMRYPFSSSSSSFCTLTGYPSIK